MRERLIQLIKQAHTDYLLNDDYAVSIYEFIADRLIENGVIVPPCKIGDTIFVIETELRNKNKIRSYIVARKVTGICGNNLSPLWVAALESPYEYRYHPTEFGKTVFLTREAAEEALKAREKQ